MKTRKIILVLFLILCFIGCATVPITGRSQLMMMSKAEEERIGEVAFYNFIIPLRNQGKIIYRDDPRPEMRQHIYRVNKILGKIMDATGWHGEYKWKFIILDESKRINAGMYPAGKMVIFTGLLNFAKSDDELACIIGHEVAHGIARHSAERYSQITTAKLTAAAIDIAVASSKKYSKYGDAIHIAVGLGAQYGVLLPYSRLHENEADFIGLLIMAKAGYDLQAAIQLFERMERKHPGNPIEFLSTHPSYGTRISNLKEWLPLAVEYNKDPLKPLPTKKVKTKTSEEQKPPIQPAPSPKPLPPKEGPKIEPKVQKTEKTPTQIQEKCDAPILSVGDSWRFRDEYDKEWEFKVARVEDDLYIIEGPGSDELFAYDKNTMDIKFRLDQGGKAIQTIYDTRLYFDFPLYIGKKWMQVITAPAGRGSLMPNTYVREYKCISYENVTVKAGMFEAIKIKYKSTNITRGTSGEGWIWYSPEVKKHIKAVFEGSYFIRVPNYGLVSFKLREEQPPPPEIKSPPQGTDIPSKPQPSEGERPQTITPVTPPLPPLKENISPPIKPQLLTPVTPAPGINIVVVTGTSANIRSGAGNEFPIATTVKQGDKLILLGKYGDWFNVRLENGQEGWINNRFVK